MKLRVFIPDTDRADAAARFAWRLLDARGETFTFKHALIQDAAYASLLLSTRRTYHRRIAQVMFGFGGGRQAVPEEHPGRGG